jgi:hypothetical protein
VCDPRHTFLAYAASSGKCVGGRLTSMVPYSVTLCCLFRSTKLVTQQGKWRCLIKDTPSSSDHYEVSVNLNIEGKMKDWLPFGWMVIFSVPDVSLERK